MPRRISDIWAHIYMLGICMHHLDMRTDVGVTCFTPMSHMRIRVIDMIEEGKLFKYSLHVSC